MGFDWEYILDDTYDVQQAYDDLLDMTERILNSTEDYDIHTEEKEDAPHLTQMTAFMLEKCQDSGFAKSIRDNAITNAASDFEEDEPIPFEET